MDKNLVQQADRLLSRAYLEGCDYSIEDLRAIFGSLECMLGDDPATPETQIAHRCAALAYHLLETSDRRDLGMVREHAAALFRGLARYDALDA